MLVGLYPRVSTKEQADEGYSIGEQVERLTKYCEAMGWTVYKVYTDAGYSGGNIDRPALREMIRDVEAGKLDKVVVYKLDRLSRSQLDTLYLIEKVFLANDTDFVSMTENFDTSTSFGRAMIGILAVFAQLEREKIKERMIMGKEARAKEGKWNGGSVEPIGYDYDAPRDLLVINEYEVMQCLELSELFLKGTPLRRIETIFREKGYKHKHGYWTPRTMRSVLRSKLYLGYVNYNGQSYRAEHPAIWDEETHAAHVKLLNARHEQYLALGITAGKCTTYLGGLLFCKRCGARYTKQENGRRKEGKPRVYWYVCHSRGKKSKKMIKDPNCKNKNWKMQDLDAIVFDEIRKLSLVPERITEIQSEKKTSNAEPNKIDILESEIARIDEQISRFMDLYGIGKFTIEQVGGKIDPLNEQRRALTKELEAMNAEAGRISYDEAVELVSSFDDVLESGDFDAVRLAIESLIYYIEIDGEDIYIHWKFA